MRCEDFGAVKVAKVMLLVLMPCYRVKGIQTFRRKELPPSSGYLILHQVQTELKVFFRHYFSFKRRYVAYNMFRVIQICTYSAFIRKPESSYGGTQSSEQAITSVS
jgi:hypothetical protein